MFKAKLIDNLDYYPLKRKALAISLGSLIMISIVSYLEAPFFIMVLIGIVAVLVGVREWQVQKSLQSTFGNQRIEISSSLIQIVDQKTKAIKAIPIDEIDQIRIREQYTMPEESLKDIVDEARGNHTRNYLTIERNGEEETFEFVIDSYYMIEQMKKVVQAWQAAGVSIQQLEKAE